MKGRIYLLLDIRTYEPKQKHLNKMSLYQQIPDAQFSESSVIASRRCDFKIAFITCGCKFAFVFFLNVFLGINSFEFRVKWNIKMKQPIYKYFLLRQKQNLYVHCRNTILKQYLFRCILKCWTYREGTAAVDKRILFAVFTTRISKT